MSEDINLSCKSVQHRLATQWGYVKSNEWVGLTHDEVNSWELPECPTVFEFAQFVEAKLKEKNNA